MKWGNYLNEVFIDVIRSSKQCLLHAPYMYMAVHVSEIQGSITPRPLYILHTMYSTSGISPGGLKPF